MAVKNKGLICDSKILLESMAVSKKYWQGRHYARAVDQYTEEAAELNKAFMKERRKRDMDENIRDEIADVMLCLEFIIREKGFTKRDINKRINIKAKKMIADLAIGRE